MKDPILEEVWKAKDELAAKHDYDVRAICDDLRRQQKNSQWKTVSFVKAKKN